MPLFMDRHDVPGATAEDVAAAHVSDLEVAGRFGVQFFSYWFDHKDGAVFCFANAPSPTSMTQVHNASHGLVPAEIIEVSEDDVLRFLGRVQDPADASEVTSSFRVIIFTDLEKSTEMLDQLGEPGYMLLLTEHDLVIRRALVSHRGREVKHTGDGFLISFEDVPRALEWARDVMSEFAKLPPSPDGHVLRIRMGISAGEPVDHNDDIFGKAVTTASRICTAARGGQVLVSDVVHEMGSDRGFQFGEGQPLVLKGFAKPVPVFELLLEG